LFAVQELFKLTLYGGYVDAPVGRRSQSAILAWIVSGVAVDARTSTAPLALMPVALAAIPHTFVV